MSDDSAIIPSAEEFKKQSRKIVIFGLTLMVGAAISVGLCSFVFPSTFSHIVIGLLIAAFQVTLQLVVFMHLKDERGIIYKFLVFTLFFVMALFVLTALAKSDPLRDKAFSPAKASTK